MFKKNYPSYPSNTTRGFNKYKNYNPSSNFKPSNPPSKFRVNNPEYKHEAQISKALTVMENLKDFAFNKKIYDFEQKECLTQSDMMYEISEYKIRGLFTVEYEGYFITSYFILPMSRDTVKLVRDIICERNNIEYWDGVFQVRSTYLFNILHELKGD